MTEKWIKEEARKNMMKINRDISKYKRSQKEKFQID